MGALHPIASLAYIVLRRPCWYVGMAEFPQHENATGDVRWFACQSGDITRRCTPSSSERVRRLDDAEFFTTRVHEALSIHTALTIILAVLPVNVNNCQQLRIGK